MRIHIQNSPPGTPHPITEEQWFAAATRAGVVHDVSIGDTPSDFSSGMSEAEALIVATTALRPLLPLRANNLRIIYCLSAGLDLLAPFEWLPPGVALLNNSGTHSIKGGEYVLMAMLMLANRMPKFIADQQARVWSQECGFSLFGQRLTILGLGALGSTVAAHGAALGMVVTGVRTRSEPHPHCHKVLAIDALDMILPETDMLVLTLPLTMATRHIMNRRRLELLPKTAGLINIGRGGLLDQKATCELLRNDSLGGAVLDVFEHEPIPAGDLLWTTPNLIITPHMAAGDPARQNAISLDIFLQNVALYQEGGTMPNLFDITTGY